MFSSFTPILGEMIQICRAYVSLMGWFNHQLVIFDTLKGDLFAGFLLGGCLVMFPPKKNVDAPSMKMPMTEYEYGPNLAFLDVFGTTLFNQKEPFLM